MKVSEQIEIGSAVFFRCTNPATGFVKRMARDRSWADVEWNWGIGCSGVRRCKLDDLIKLTPALNRFLMASNFIQINNKEVSK